MKVGDTVMITDYEGPEDLQNNFIGKQGVIVEDLTESEYEEFYRVEFSEDNKELFYDNELKVIDTIEDFIEISIDIPESVIDQLEDYANRSGLSKDTIIRYIMTDYILKEKTS